MRNRYAWLGLGLSAALLCFNPACSTAPASGQQADGFDRQALLRSVAEEVVLPTYHRFQSEAQALHTAVTTYANAVEVGAIDVATQQQQAQQAWRDAMSIWQEAELLQFGPAGANTQRAGGIDLRDDIYSWPTVNPCRVDQELVAEGYAEPGFVDAAVVNVYGFDALEYLLFYTGTDNHCPPQLAINQGPWELLDSTHLVARRAAYAAVVSAQLLEHADRLVAAWSPDASDFATAFVNAGTQSSVYADTSEALDDVLAGLFYLDLVTKDRKLAEPAGMVNCSADTCPEALESPWAGHAKASILANLRGFQRLFHGGDSPANATGFDDFLSTLGATELATTMTDDITTAIAAVEAIEGSLADALENNPEAVEGAYHAIKDLTDNLKGPLAILLNLQLPTEGAGDND